MSIGTKYYWTHPKKNPSVFKITIISGIFVILWAIVQWFFWILPIGKNCKNYDVSFTGNNNKSIVWDNTQYIENIKQPLPLEIKDEKILKDNISKIQALFRYRNAKEYDSARNTIDKAISWLFTPEKVMEFREKLTQIISIISIEQDGEIGNSDFLNYSKHVVSLAYAYQSRSYQEKWNIVVERSERDPSQHHITMFKCIEGDGPLCKTFSQ